MSQAKQPTNTGALATLVIVFFFWGFIAASNSIFIPFAKTHFQLNQFESQLIGSAFYGAYFIGSLILFILSNLFGYDILNNIGYKKVENNFWKWNVSWVEFFQRRSARTIMLCFLVRKVLYIV